MDVEEPYVASIISKVDRVINDDIFGKWDIVQGENECVEEARTGSDINTIKE